MYGPQPYRRKTFFEVAFKGWLRYVFIIGLVLLIAGIAVYGVLASLKPSDVHVDAQQGPVSLDVSDLSTSPITITCSHTWKVTPSTSGLYTADSLFIVYYTILIVNHHGDTVYNQSNSVELPLELTFYGYGTVDHQESNSNPADLSPGHYEITVTSSQSLSCTAAQNYKYKDAMVGMILVSLMGVIFIALWVWLGLYTMKHTSLTTPVGAPSAPQQAQPPASQPSYYSRMYSSQGIPPATNPPVYQPAPSYQAQQAPTYSYPQSYGTSSQELISQSQPQDYDPSRSNLEYRQGGYVTELVCSNCHRPVRSQPVYGVVTCESCGEKARVF